MISSMCQIDLLKDFLIREKNLSSNNNAKKGDMNNKRDTPIFRFEDKLDGLTCL